MVTSVRDPCGLMACRMLETDIMEQVQLFNCKIKSSRIMQ